MSHIRRQIRDYVVAAIRAWGNVKVSVGRTTPYPKDLTTAINISWLTEQSQDDDQGDNQTRLIGVRVEAAARAGSDETENLLDDLCLRTERLFATDPTLGGLIAAYEYRGTEFATSGAGGDSEFATAAMLFALTVFTKTNLPGN